jgi:Predicted membrane protein
LAPTQPKVKSSAKIYQVLPDVNLAWNDVWIGAAITSVLFTIGKSLIGIYLGGSSVASTYGAAGSFVNILLWINSAQILFLGAELPKFGLTDTVP